MRDSDRLSVVSFGAKAVVHVDGAQLALDARPAIRAAIENLANRRDTNLNDGWLTGAECVARASEGVGLNQVIPLSDGEANAGIVDPGKFALHATELARRSVTTSCVGIGDDYNPVLQAIAEHGGGRPHRADEVPDIVATLMGEFSEIESIAAQDVSIALHVPATAKAAVLASVPTSVATGARSVFLDALLADRPRACVFRVTLPAGKVDETVLFGVTAPGTAPDRAPSKRLRLRSRSRSSKARATTASLAMPPPR